MNDENKTLIEAIRKQADRDSAYVEGMKSNPRKAIFQEFKSFWNFSKSAGNYLTKS